MKFQIGIACVAMVTSGSAVSAEWSANVGWLSEYHYRGIFQNDSSASAGLDVENNGLYAGTWVADVGDGLEIDGYFGYGGETGGFGYSVGFTGYYYTGDFDDTYQEMNLRGSWSVLSADVAIGEYKNFTGPTLDYTFVSLTAKYESFFGTIGSFSRDFDGEFLELGYATTIADFDFTVSAIFANDDLVGSADESLILGVSKSFGL